MKKFISELDVVLGIEQPMSLYYDNTGIVAQAKEPRSHHKSKHILRRFHLVWEIVERCDVIVKLIDTKNNMVDSLTKALSMQQFDRHLDSMGIKYRGDWL